MNNSGAKYNPGEIWHVILHVPITNKKLFQYHIYEKSRAKQFETFFGDKIKKIAEFVFNGCFGLCVCPKLLMKLQIYPLVFENF